MIARTLFLSLALTAMTCVAENRQTQDRRTPVLEAADKIVKIYGVGGLRGIEAYQSGVVISAEGHVMTANSLVLDQGEVTIVRSNGDRYSGEVLGADPFADIAVVKIDPVGQELPYFDLPRSPTAMPGETVFALANVFGIATGDEPVSVMRSVVAAVAPLRAEQGPLKRIDGGEVYILDAVTSNPGAAGGALVDARGRLIGMLGRELKSRVTGAWMSYALPVEQLRVPVERVLQGHESTSAYREDEAPEVDLLRQFGFETVVEIVPRTPPYVDHIRTGSPAADAGLALDDLVVSVDGLVTASVVEMRRLIGRKGPGSAIKLVVQRGDDFIEIELAPLELEAEE